MDKRTYYRYKKVHKDRCTQNLSALYGCLKFYAGSNNGRLPEADNGPGIMELLKYGALKEHFLCEAARGKKIRRDVELRPERIPYIYFGGANLDRALKRCPKMILMCDKPDSGHCNVLLADGSVLELNEFIRRNKIKTSRKISSCRDIVEILNHIYNYPPDILDVLRKKAARFDKERSGRNK